MVRETNKYNRSSQWFAIDGDNTLRLDYDLNQDSVVFDVGGYLGLSSSKLWDKFKCNIYIFEPVEEFADQIRERFKGNQKIHVFTFGLSDKNTYQKISVKDDASSIFKENESSRKIKLVKISDFLKENHIKKIDLLEINIEGGEYQLIRNIIDSGYINNIENLQVQFHDFFIDSEEKMESIQRQLSKTHYLTFQYKLVWENWRKKAEPKSMREYGLVTSDLYRQLESRQQELNDAREKNLASDLTIRSLLEVNTVQKEQISSLEIGLKNSMPYKIGYHLIHPLYVIKEKVKNIIKV